MKHQFWKGFLKQGGIQEVACVGVVDGDKILMGKRRDNNKWTNPGGHMNPGETPLEGAVRELFEETGIKADPKDLEHLATRMVTKPDGKQLKIHAFKLDEGKHKTTMAGDPDQEVYRWTWQPLPLKEEVSLNLHVQHKNVLFDAMKIRYGQAKIMNGDHYEHLQQAMHRHFEPAFKKMDKHAAGEAGNPGGFMGAVHDHFHHLDMVVPMPMPQEEEQKDHAPSEEKEDPNAGAPMAKMGMDIGRRLLRMRIRKSEPGPLQNEMKRLLASNEAHHAHNCKDMGE